jgi:hypothetical protein
MNSWEMHQRIIRLEHLFLTLLELDKRDVLGGFPPEETESMRAEFTKCVHNLKRDWERDARQTSPLSGDVRVPTMLP